MNPGDASSKATAADHDESDAVRTTPLVTVCIANFNGEHLIAACIRSVLEQRDAPEMQIIVHDDASTDRSLDVIRRFPRVELLASPRNIGFCASNNRMAARADGKYLLLLNNDAELLPDALRSLSDAACSVPQSAICTLPQFDHASGALVDRGQLLDPFLNPIPNLDPGRTTVALASGSCLWISRELWQRIGGMPEYFENLAEDLYLCLYARTLGVTVSALGRSGYLHHIGSSLGGGKAVDGRLQTSYRRRRGSERNKTFCMVLFYPLPALLVMLPLHLLALSLEGFLLAIARRSFRTLSEVYLPVFAALVRRAGDLAVARRAIQRRRSCSSREFFRTFRCMPWKIVLWWRHGLPEIR